MAREVETVPVKRAKETREGCDRQKNLVENEIVTRQTLVVCKYPNENNIQQLRYGWRTSQRASEKRDVRDYLTTTAGNSNDYNDVVVVVDDDKTTIFRQIWCN